MGSITFPQVCLTFSGVCRSGEWWGIVNFLRYAIRRLGGNPNVCLGGVAWGNNAELCISSGMSSGGWTKILRFFRVCRLGGIVENYKFPQVCHPAAGRKSFGFLGSAAWGGNRECHISSGMPFGGFADIDKAKSIEA